MKEPLCNFFASFYALASLKEAWVADLWEDLGGGWRGDFGHCDSQGMLMIRR